MIPGHEQLVLATSILNCIRAIGGFTEANSAATLFDSENFNESKYLHELETTSGNLGLILNW